MRHSTHHSIKAGLWLGVLLFAAEAARAQEPVNLAGKIVDETGKGIEGVTVTLKGRKLAALTSADGTYRFGGTSSIAAPAPAASPFSFDNGALGLEVGEEGMRVKVELLSLS